MVSSKSGLDNEDFENKEENPEEVISDTSSDVSMSDSDDEEPINEVESEADDSPESSHEEEEDEVIKAIRRENERQNDHPPTIHCEDFVTNISFHPQEDIIAAATITGDVVLYKYSNQENSLLKSLELHTKACRDVEFSEDGKILFSTSKDKAIMLSDVETGLLNRFYDDAHDVPIFCIKVLSENLFATGDDDGIAKIWDVRQRKTDPVFSVSKNEDYISDIITNEGKEYVLCSSGDGSLTTIDLRNTKFHMQSEEYDEELSCMGLLRTETKLVLGTSSGKHLVYNWNEFGLHSDEFTGPKVAINSLIPVTENIVISACDDGNLRATHFFPNRHLGIVGQHDMSVERVDICNNGAFVASCSHNNEIKFWNIQYFEDFESVSNKHNKHQKRKELRHNLPSSKRTNVSDFFSDM